MFSSQSGRSSSAAFSSRTRASLALSSANAQLLSQLRAAAADAQIYLWCNCSIVVKIRVFFSFFSVLRTQATTSVCCVLTTFSIEEFLFFLCIDILKCLNERSSKMYSGRTHFYYYLIVE